MEKSLRMIKPTHSSLFGFVASLAVLSGLTHLSAGSLPDMQSDYVTRYEPILRAVPALELPAKSASLVTAATAAQKEPVAVAIVTVVSKVNPSSLPPVVGAISRAEPAVANRIVAQASKLQPTLINSIKTAAAGSPSRLETPLIPPAPTDNNGKHKGHYKNGQLGWYP
jgi:hypothetical protein